MNPRAVIVLGLCSLLPGLAGPRESPDVKKIVAAVERHYNGLRTMEADFVERYTLGSQTLVESGHVYFEKPGKSRWNYDQPPGKFFLTDGDYAYLYSPGEQVVRRQPLKGADEWQAALALLLGRIDFGKSFDQVKAFQVHQLQSVTQWQLQANAKSDRQPFREVWMDLTEDYRVTRLEIRQRDGSLMEFHFRNWQENVHLSAEIFRLALPPGTSWVDEGSR